MLPHTPHNILLLIIILGAVHLQTPHSISFFLNRNKKKEIEKRKKKTPAK